MNSISTFDITKEALPDFLLHIQQGKIQLPDLQRSFCWPDDQVKELIASVSLAWPVGAVLLLLLGNSNVKFKPRLIEGVTLKIIPEPSKLILDGQQRSTALFMALFSSQPVWIKEKKSQKIQERWYYIDIEKALDPFVEREEAIISLPASRIKSGFGINGSLDCSTPQKEYETLMFPVEKVFHYASWRAAYSKYWHYDAAKLELIDRFESEIIKKFEHYQIPIIQLRPELSKLAVCRVFEKINTISSELNFFDLTTAFFASVDFSLRDDFEATSQRLHKFSVLQGVKNTDWLQAVTLVATYHRRMEALKSNPQISKPPGVACRRNEVLSLSLEEYQRFSAMTASGYEEAARFFHGQKILSSEDIAYPVQLVGLAAILSIIGFPHELRRSKLEQWWWCGIFGEMYTGWNSSRTARDMLEVPEWLQGGGRASTVELASFAPHRLLSVCRRHGAVYKGLNALLRRNGAIDFLSGEALSDVKFFDDAIESHHVFPVAWCQKQGIATEKYNCLINRTPLSEATNRFIGGKAPSFYLSKLEQQGISRQRLNEILRSHLIEPATLWNDDFEAFFELRTQALVELISKAMGKSITPASTQLSGGENRDGNVKNGKVRHSRSRGANSQTRAGV